MSTPTDYYKSAQSFLKSKLSADVVDSIVMPMCYDSAFIAIKAENLIGIKIFLNTTSMLTFEMTKCLEAAIECSKDEITTYVTDKIMTCELFSLNVAFETCKIAIRNHKINILSKLLDKMVISYDVTYFNYTVFDYKYGVIKPAIQYFIEVLDDLVLNHPINACYDKKTLKRCMTESVAYCIEDLKDEQKADQLINILEKRDLFQITQCDIKRAFANAAENNLWHVALKLIKMGILRTFDNDYLLNAFYGYNIHLSKWSHVYKPPSHVPFECVERIMCIIEMSIRKAKFYADDFYQIPFACKTLFNYMKEILLSLDLLTKALGLTITHKKNTFATHPSARKRKMNVGKYIYKILKGVAYCLTTPFKTHLDEYLSNTDILEICIRTMVIEITYVCSILDHVAKCNGKKYYPERLDIGYLLYVDRCKLWPIVEKRHAKIRAAMDLACHDALPTSQRELVAT